MKPAMICFMGLDGSGKSTSIEYACQQLKNRGGKVEIVRAAYVIVFLRGVIALGKKLLMKKDSDPFSGDYRAYLESLRRNADRGGVYQIFSFLTAMEFKAQILFQIRLKRWLGRTLLVDRYIYDNVVTCAANLDLGEEYMEKTMNGKWKHAPRPDKIIYIRTPVEVCFARKDDIPDPLYLEIRQPRYEAVARMYGADVISGGQDLTMVQEILCQAMDAVHKVCQENGIAYYLIGGSALGAVRHRGFIPWDVDIDIGMHRTQYEAFARIAPACPRGIPITTTGTPKAAISPTRRCGWTMPKRWWTRTITAREERSTS